MTEKPSKATMVLAEACEKAYQDVQTLRLKYKGLVEACKKLTTLNPFRSMYGLESHVEEVFTKWKPQDELPKAILLIEKLLKDLDDA